MAMTILTADVRPAKITRTYTRLSKTTARAVDMARLHLRTGNPGAYARSLAGEHRATNKRQQRATEAAITADACEHLFTRHPANCCLMAWEG
jgi:hypothetical protein